MAVESTLPLVVHHDGVEGTWTLSFSGGGRHLELRSPSGTSWTGHGLSTWAAFRALRSVVEPIGMRLCCNGARPNAHASRMSVDMGGGGAVYLLKLGHPVRRKSAAADLFAYAPNSEVSTVEDQDQFYEHWLRSLK